MPEIDAVEAYETVMADLEHRLPELHSEVVAEITRGRELRASEISRADTSSRNRELTRQRLGKLAEGDLGVVALTPEERLNVLIRAISVAAESHNASTATLARFAEGRGVEHFDFVSPDNHYADEASMTAAEGEEPERLRRSLDLTSDEAMTVSREAIDAVLETLDVA